MVSVGAGDDVQGVRRVVVDGVPGHLYGVRASAEFGGQSDDHRGEGQSGGDDREQLHDESCGCGARTGVWVVRWV